MGAFGKTSVAVPAIGRTKSTVLSLWADPTIIAMATSAGIAAHLVLRYLVGAPKTVTQIPLLAVLTVGGLPVVFVLGRKLLAGEFGADHLAGISIITSIILGEYLVSAIVILMLSGGTALEQFASRRASSVLDALAKRMPQIAHRKAGAALSDVRLEEVAVGDTLVIFPHEICPVDGVVVDGHGKRDSSVWFLLTRSMLRHFASRICLGWKAGRSSSISSPGTR